MNGKPMSANDRALPDEQVFLTRKQVADLLQTSVSTIERWASAGSGPKYSRLGAPGNKRGPCRYRLSEVLAYAASRERGQS